MKNKFYKFCLISFLFLFCFKANSVEQFNFNITEIEILENGNKFKGIKRGEISTVDGIVIIADEFLYNKKLNILDAKGNVEIRDNINNYLISTNKIKYLKNENLILTYEKSSASNLKDRFSIDAKNFEYDLSNNKLSAVGNVVLKDELNNFTLNTDKIIYFKNDEKYLTKGKTKALVQSKYDFNSKDLIFLKQKMELSSLNKTRILTDKNQLFTLSKFKYFINKQELRGEKVTVITDYNAPKSDKFYFDSGFFDLKNQKFIAKKTKIKLHKEIFGNSENDPTLVGVSSKTEGGVTTINKAIFTSCNEKDDCPPWSLQAEEIQHDKNKKELKYKNALLKIYNIPVLYFPKFFHPDPTVERQTGFLKPEINNSNILSNSLSLPYYKVLSASSDFTLIPTLFDNGIVMAQNEF